MKQNIAIIFPSCLYKAYSKTSLDHLSPDLADLIDWQFSHPRQFFCIKKKKAKKKEVDI